MCLVALRDTLAHAHTDTEEIRLYVSWELLLELLMWVLMMLWSSTSADVVPPGAWSRPRLAIALRRITEVAGREETGDGRLARPLASVLGGRGVSVAAGWHNDEGGNREMRGYRVFEGLRPRTVRWLVRAAQPCLELRALKGE